VCKIVASALQLANYVLFSILVIGCVQLHLPAVRAQTKTSYNLFNELA